MTTSSDDQLPASSRHVAKALRERGITAQVRELPASTRTAAEAAQAVGCSPAAIANSLVFMSDEEPLLIMTSGANRVDTAALAARLGRSSIDRASPQQVREATGQVIGGVAPLGHPRPVTTVIDESLAEHEQIWAAAGTPRTVFPTSYAQLLAITDATPARVTS